MSRSARASLAGLIGYGIWGFSFLFSKVALDIADTFVLLATRFLLAFLVLNLLVLTKKCTIALRGKPILPLLVLGLVQPILYFICEQYGIARTSSAFAGVMLGLVPVIGLILGRLFLGESCTRWQAMCALLSIAGVALTTVGGMGTFSLVGTLLLTGAALSASLFTAISRGISQHFSAFERTYVMFALGSTLFTAVALARNWGSWDAFLIPYTTPAFWCATLYLAVFASVCAFLLLNYAMNEISVGRASLFSNFTTVISILAGIFILGDAFTAAQLIGMTVIVLSVCGVTCGPRSKNFP